MSERQYESWLTRYGIIAVLALQVFIFSLRLSDPFIDGRFHTNWGPPFWLMKAEQMHAVNFPAAYFGVVSGSTRTPSGAVIADSWYMSHPQFIALPLYVWTGIFGFHEWTVRSLAAMATLAATIIMWGAMRQRHTPQEAIIFSLVWALLPVIILYGSKLDQEPFVLLFLSIACYAHERFQKGTGNVPWLFGVALIFMLWADWSGFVFAACFAALFFYGRRHPRTRQLLWATLVGGIAGATIVGMQTALTRSRDSAQNSFTGLLNVYKYRSGSAHPNFWYKWLNRQFTFFRLNFGTLGSPVAIAGIAWWISHGAPSVRNIREEGTRLWQVFAAIAVGTVIYAFIVPQATGIHIYYQIFYSYFVAYGIMRGYEWLVEWYKKKYSIRAATVVSYLLALFLAVQVYEGAIYIYQDVSDGWGGVEEINLLKKLRLVPPTKKVVAIVDQKTAVWLANANIEWYTGRTMANLAPEQGALADWAVITADKYDLKIKALNTATPTSTAFISRECSPWFCLIERIPK